MFILWGVSDKKKTLSMSIDVFPISRNLDALYELKGYKLWTYEKKHWNQFCDEANKNIINSDDNLLMTSFPTTTE